MFSQDELQLIFDALDALESSKSSNEMMTMMLGGIFIQEKEEREEFFERSKDRMNNPGEEAIVLAERIILLKAKLIQMKDKAVAEEFEI